jgi:phage pi2 protein 07
MRQMFCISPKNAANVLYKPKKCGKWSLLARKMRQMVFISQKNAANGLY